MLRLTLCPKQNRLSLNFRGLGNSVIYVSVGKKDMLLYNLARKSLKCKLEEVGYNHAQKRAQSFSNKI